MFDFKHEIKLADSTTTRLFGEDYFCDKSTFWNAHQSMLNDLYRSVCETGFPIEIHDLEHKTYIQIHSLNEFHNWLKKHQPFDPNVFNE